jgi:DNA-binding protein HU-beta
MRKTEIVQRVAEALGSTNVQEEGAVTAVLVTIEEALQQGDPVILRRCGTWQVRSKRARVGRNSKTGAAAAISARWVVRFVVSWTLKQAAAEGDPLHRASWRAPIPNCETPRTPSGGRPTLHKAPPPPRPVRRAGARAHTPRSRPRSTPRR